AAGSDRDRLMAYAAVSDMVQRFGERELVNNTTPSGEAPTTIDEARVDQVLGDASTLIDSYLNRRYAVPLATPPATVVNVCCRIARVDLANTGDTQPTEQMVRDRREAIAWLELLSRGTISLDGVMPANVTANFSRVRTRPAGQSHGGLW
ncbi:MAG: DUF1320 domain-containing protein, partial [Gluconacetobacter sp.]